MAQMAVAMGGGLIGSMFGMPQIGMLVGSLVGGIFFGNKNKDVQKMGDLRVAGSSYGAGIPRVWGTVRVAGNVIWATDLIERPHKKSKEEKTGGKGQSGKSPDSYDYFANFAVVVCEGPVNDVLRIWADNDLIYDKLNKGQYYAPGTRPWMTKDEFKKKRKRNADPRIRPRIYYGDEAQLPDPMIYGYVTGNIGPLDYRNSPNWGTSSQGGPYVETSGVPAYRGRCVLVWQEMPLESFGNHIPNIEVEITKVRSTVQKWEIQEFRRSPIYAGQPIDNYNDRVCPVIDYSRQVMMTGDRNCHRWDMVNYAELERFVAPGYQYAVACFPKGNIIGPTTDDEQGPNGTVLGLYDNKHGYQKKLRKYGEANWGPSNGKGRLQRVIYVGGNNCNADDMSAFGISKEAQAIVFGIFGATSLWSDELECLQAEDLYLPRGTDVMCVNGGEFDKGYGKLAFLVGAMDFAYLGDAYVFQFKSFRGDEVAKHNAKYGLFWMYKRDDYSTPTSVCEGITICNVFWDQASFRWAAIVAMRGGKRDGYWLFVYGKKGGDEDKEWVLLYEQPVTEMHSTVHALNLQGQVSWISSRQAYTLAFNPIQVEEIPYSVGGAPLPAANSVQFYNPTNNTIIYWSADDSPEYKKNVPRFDGNWFVFYGESKPRTDIGLDEIVGDICRDVGLTDNDIDVTDLAQYTVPGYVIEGTVGGRSAIEELQKVFLFDGAEIDGKLVFKVRGKKPVVEIPYDDLLPVDKDTGDWYKETRTEEVDIPSRVVITYNEIWKDYQQNTQYAKRVFSPVRTMQSRQQMDLKLQASSHPDQIKQQAYKILQSAWTERVKHDYILPYKYLAYDPTDVFTVVDRDGTTFTERALKVDFGADWTLKVSTVSQDGAAFVSDASGAYSGFTRPASSETSQPPDAVALDIPLLRDSDDTPGPIMYLGATNAGGTYNGADVGVSLNDADFSFVPDSYRSAVVSVGPVRSGAVPPPAGGCFATDLKTKITIARNGTFKDLALSNISDDEFYEGIKNIVVIGQEIIIFRDVEISEDNTYMVISHLARGRRGTDWAAGIHQEGEDAYFIDSAIKPYAAQYEYVGRDIYFGAVSKGTTWADTTTVKVKLTGASLKPFAVSEIRRQDKVIQGSSAATFRYRPKDAQCDITVSWLLRSRFTAPMLDGQSTITADDAYEVYDAYILKQAFDPAADFDPAAAYVQRKFEGLDAPSFTYTFAQQQEDNHDGGLDPLHVVVFMKSTRVGRGFPSSATLTRYQVV